MQKKFALIAFLILFLMIITPSINGNFEDKSYNLVHNDVFSANSFFDEWNKTYGGFNTDRASAFNETADGGFIIFGDTASYASEGRDVWLIKTDSNGDELWNVTFNNSKYDNTMCGSKTVDGGYIILTRYGWLIKTNETGRQLWNRSVGNGCWVQQTSDNGYIITGGGTDLTLIKTNETGIVQWSKTFGMPGSSYFDYGFCVQQTNDSGYIVSGYTYSYGRGLWLIKTDANGIEQWNKTYGGILINFRSEVQQTIDGGYIIIFSKDYYGGSAIWVLKTDFNGSIEWDNIFYLPEYLEWPWMFEGCSIDKTIDGGYIVGGDFWNGWNSGTYDIWLNKIDSNGSFLWDKIFSSSSEDHCSMVRQTSDGDYVIAGSTMSSTGYFDVWMIKTGEGANNPPNPPVIEGPTNGVVGVEYDYTLVSVDPEGDYVCYYVEWGDGTHSDSVFPTPSGKEVIMSHTWTSPGNLQIIAKSRDHHNYESNWTEPLIITIFEYEPPTPPIINGPTHGRVGIKYDYTFNSTDQNCYELIYLIEWGDGTHCQIMGFSGKDTITNHTWSKKGTYVITAKSKNIWGIESGLGILKVSMPRNYSLLIPRLLECFRYVFLIIRQLMWL